MKIFNSIRWRLQIWYGLILVVVLAGFGVTAFQMERARLLGRIDNDLRRRVGVIGDLLRQPPRERGPGGPMRDGPPPDAQPRDDQPLPDGRGPRGFNRMPTEFHLPPREAALFDETDTNGFYYILWRRDGVMLALSTNAPNRQFNDDVYEQPGINQMPVPKDTQKAPPSQDVTLVHTKMGIEDSMALQMRGTFREVEINTPPGERILVGRSIASDLRDLHLATLELAGVGGIILFFGLAGGWWMASRAIRPIQNISSAAAKISAGDLSQRINTDETESELGKLAAVLNSTFARLETSFAQQQQFTSDAAHELRTPVTVMLTQTQMALNRERSVAEYRETLAACQRSAQRMRRLIESLLELARLDAGQEQLKQMAFDCSATVHECVESIQPLADERGVALIAEAEPLNCVGDPERISQVITNLLTNAIQYNRIGGQVRIGLKRENGLATMTVSDNGVGIPALDLPHVFERFYRGDKARSTSNGHSGLGLAICKAIVGAHSGTIEVSSEAERGTTFIVRLPALT